MAHTRASLDQEVRKRAGCKDLRFARSTGTLVGLYEAEPAGLDTESGKWATVCETHGSILCHQTRSVAQSHLSHPEDWCPYCQGDVLGLDGDVLGLDDA